MDINNEYGTLEIQKQLLELLKTFHSFCVENNIKYSLDWGSLLGAIRHKGFIPWDDDLDIMVDRENYQKLQKLIGSDNRLSFDITSPNTLWIPRIRLTHNNGGFIYPPTIDVLIMDNAPNNTVVRHWRVLIIKILQGMLKVKPHFDKGCRLMRMVGTIVYWIGQLVGRVRKLRWYTKLAQLSNRYPTREITSYYEEYSCLGRYYPNNLMKEMILVPFENMEVYAVKNYHECLVIQFGTDYMTPIKTRENHTEKAKNSSGRTAKGIIVI